MKFKVLIKSLIILLGVSMFLLGCGKKSGDKDITDDSDVDMIADDSDADIIDDGFVGEVWDGQSSAYNWTKEELQNEWIQINVADGGVAQTLDIDESTVSLTKEDGEILQFDYSIQDDVDVYGRPDNGEWIALVTDDNCPFSDFIFHEEQVGETVYDTYPMISGVIADLDSDTPIIVTQFVLKGNLEYFPEGYKGSVYGLYLPNEK